MNILVTGGAGFIGSHVVDAHIKNGHRVTVVDNLSTGFRRNLHPRARFYNADIRNLSAILRIFKKERPAVVNHHAALASVIESMRDPGTTIAVNTVGTMNLLCAAHAGGVKKFIFASTGGAMYGSPRKIPVSERAPAEPTSPYGLSKRLAEACVEFYGREHRLSYLIFRYANVYGPRQNPKGEAGVVAIFGGRMKRRARPTIFGDGNKSRDYVYVGDVARANIIALSRGENVTLNIGTGIPTTDRDVFDAVARAAGFAKEPRYAPFRPGEIRKIALDARRAEKTLRWKPLVAFEAGIRRTIDAM